MFALRSLTSWPLVASAWTLDEFNDGKHKGSPLRSDFWGVLCERNENVKWSSKRAGTVLVSAQVWIVQAAERLEAGLLVAPILAALSAKRESQAVLCSKSSLV